MADLLAVEAALRARALALVVATTGVMSLASDANGFVRTTGSFVVDGFVVGMEVQPVGFATNAPQTITDVTALNLKVSGGHAVEGAAGARSLTVAIPARGEENEDFSPEPDRQFAELEFVHATEALQSTPASNGTKKETGLFYVRWYFINGVGSLGPRSCMEALRQRFSVGTVMTAGSDQVRISENLGARVTFKGNRGAHAFYELLASWESYSTNAIAA